MTGHLDTANGLAPVTGLAAEPGIGRIDLTWQARQPYRPLVDHFAVHAARQRHFRPTADTLVGKTIDTHLRHDNLGPQGSTWYYQVETIDAAGRASDPAGPLRATSRESVTVSGTPIAVVGDFDRKGLELALSPDGYADYRTTFPDGADYTHGTDTPGAAWPYLHPGPADRWAGSTAHTFRLRFTLADAPPRDLALAIWLIDTHASIPGVLEIRCNDTAVTEVALENGATKGSLQGDATAPDSPLKPSIVELPLPAATLHSGENVLTLHKGEGSWHAYDALGVFRPRLP
ncbi:polysaccharide lyase family protein [Saccharomonospora piscinae]|uniref:polysaccharide lyase family protein n=1 Tax=Saccharomonospora piscinae TaxID=687388 RepID=UPI000463464E|nr:polysaccharide lyase family protein [Saccharomonospora piscinae]